MERWRFGKVSRIVWIAGFIMVMAGWSGCAEEEETTTRGYLAISCAEIAFPFIDKCAITFSSLYNQAYIDVVPTSSRQALVDLSGGKTRLAVLSREPNDVELETLRSSGKNLKTLTVAHDAIAVIVHGDNPVEQLDMEQLRGVFTGKITDWKELGGASRPIRPVVRDRNSGTYEVFQDKALGKESYAAGAYPCSTMAMVKQVVQSDPGAIGLSGLLMVQTGYLKAIKIAPEPGGNFVMPTQASVYKELYPLRRPVVLCYYRDADHPINLVSGFVSFVTDAKGQQVAVNQGVVPATMPVREVRINSP